MDVQEATQKYRMNEWIKIIRECRSSSMTVRTWCLQNNVNEKQFYYWQHRVRGEVFETLKETESLSQTNFVQFQAPAYFSKNIFL